MLYIKSLRLIYYITRSLYQGGTDLSLKGVCAFDCDSLYYFDFTARNQSVVLFFTRSNSDGQKVYSHFSSFTGIYL